MKIILNNVGELMLMFQYLMHIISFIDGISKEPIQYPHFAKLGLDIKSLFFLS